MKDIPRHYVINCKTNGNFSDKEETTGLSRSREASLQIPPLSMCLGSNCSREGLVQLLERTCNLS